MLSCSASVELQHACHRKGLQLGPSHVELHEIAEAAELLLKKTAEEVWQPVQQLLTALDQPHAESPQPSFGSHRQAMHAKAWLWQQKVLQ